MRRRAAAARPRSSGRRRPAASRRPRGARPRPPAMSGCRCRRGVEASAGNIRPRSPSPAAPSSASATRMQDDVAVRMTVQPRSARRSRRRPGAAARPARTDARRARSRSVGRRRTGEQVAARARSAGTVTLRLAGSPGTTWTAILQASRRAASSVQVPGWPHPEASAVRRMPRRTPCGVCAAASPERSTVAAIALTIDPLERLGHGHDRDRRTVARRRLDDRRDERRRDRAAGRRRGPGRPARRRHRAPSARARRTRIGPSPAAARRPSTNVTASPSGSHGPASSSRRVRRRHDHDRRDLRCGQHRRERVGEQRPTADPGEELVGAAHPRRAAGRDDDRIGARCRGPQSRRGWAKIMRPATVWRTRVTATSRSLSI